MSGRLEDDRVMGGASLNDRPWLSHYPPGVPHDIDPAKLRDHRAIVRDQRRALRRSRRLREFRQGLHLSAVRNPRARSRRRAPAHGPEEGRPRRGDDAQRRRRPVVLFALLISGYTVVNVNPLYSPRELARQINDSGARMIFIADACAHTLDKALERLPETQRAVLVRMGDLLGAKGMLVNFVARHVKKVIRPITCRSLTASRVSCNGARASGRRRPCPRPTSSRRTSRSCSTRAARRASRRAPFSPTPTSRRTCCRPRRGSRLRSMRTRRR